MSDKLKKWNDAYHDADIASAVPVQVLAENAFLLPEEGDALDLACGRGGNALFLAKLKHAKFQVDAVDISPVVLKKLDAYADQNNLDISCCLRDVEADGLHDKKYDVIVVSYFLYRELFPKLINALKPEGLLYYQTWSQQRIDDTGPNSEKFRLAPAELLSLCEPLVPVMYRENGLLGDVQQGSRNEAMLIAQKL